MRLLRLLIIVLAVVVPLLVGGGVYLWFVGGRALNQPMDPVARLAQAEDPNALEPTPSYHLSDLSVSADESDVALENYGRAVSQIMSVYEDKELENESALTVEAAETGDLMKIAKIAAAATRHSQAALALQSLSVPSSAARVHLNLVNSLLGLGEASFIMSKVKESPVIALESAQYTYPGRLKNFITAVNNLNLFLSASGVTLPEGERTIISLGL